MSDPHAQELKKIKTAERQQIRAAAATLRAMARRTTPVMIGPLPSGIDDFNGVTLPWTFDAARRDDSITALRGLADRAAFQKRYSDPAIFSRLRPIAAPAALLYEALERARCESCGTADFPGAGNNVQALLLKDATENPGTGDQHGALCFYFAARQVMAGYAPPPYYSEAVDSLRAAMTARGDALENLPALMRDQEAYARYTHTVIQSLQGTPVQLPLPSAQSTVAHPAPGNIPEKDTGSIAPESTALRQSAQWYKRFIRPLNFYARDHEFYRRHAAGPLSSRDIIEIEYGGTMPKGWDIVDRPYQNKPVEITTTLTNKHSNLLQKARTSLLTLGYVDIGKNKKPDISKNDGNTPPPLTLNKIMLSPIGQGATLHALSSLTMTIAPLVAALNPVGIIKTVPLLALWMITSLRNQPLTRLLSIPFSPAMDTVGHENIHVLQVRDPHETRTGYNILKKSFREAAFNKRWDSGIIGKTAIIAEMSVSYMMAPYFRADYEIQARMNTLLTHNYQSWGRMPRTKHELWAALIGAGLRAPAIIHRELAQSTEDTSVFYKPGLRATFSRAAAQALAPHIAEMNTAYWGLYRKDLKEEYWRNTLPYIYGHLTELCGDPDGLRRMGYSGPVLPDQGPVPFDAEDRKKFWAQCAAGPYEEFEIIHTKRIEALRGYYFEDTPGEKPLSAWTLEELNAASKDQNPADDVRFALLEGRETPAVKELRRAASPDATFIDARTPRYRPAPQPV